MRNLGRVLVTGADGFIGSHLVETLLESYDCEITALCLYNSFGTHGWLEPYASSRSKKLELILGDVRDAGFVDQAVTKCNTVFHLASLIAIPYSYLAPRSYFETNVNGTLNVVEACRRHGTGRLIHTSTSEVYGTAMTIPILESHPLQGQSPYSASKIAADKVVESYFTSFQLPVVTLRPFNTYGPRQSLRAVIPTIMAQVLAGQESISLGSLSPTRDFNFVQDTVDAFISVGQASDDAVLGRTFNAGSGKEISIGDLVKLIADVLGRTISVKEDIDRMRPKDSEVERLLADASLLRGATGWKPKIQLADGLRILSKWLSSQPDFLNKSTFYQR